MKRFVSIVGNRPQLIKLDPEFKQIIIYTGQHYSPSMKDVFLDELDIPQPDIDLDETELGKMVDKLIPVLRENDPHYVIVYGDTRSTVAGTIAAHQLGIPIIHVEAGCRSGNNKQIEERNRILVDKLSTIHFCPSFKALCALQDSGLGDNAYNVGAANFSTLIKKTLPTEPLQKDPYSILTIHREENTDSVAKLENIFKGLEGCDHEIIFPIHPRTKKFIEDNKVVVPKGIRVVDPFPYKKFIHAIGHAQYAITDSGGVQTEAYFLRTPCITLREETEWRETVEEKWNVLVGTNPILIQRALKEFKPKKQRHQSEAYGKGRTHKIMRAILENL